MTAHSGSHQDAYRDRDDGGRYVSTRDTAEVLNALDPFEPYTTGELVEITGWPRRTVFQALNELAEEGTIRKKKPNPTNAIWMLIENGEDA